MKQHCINVRENKSAYYQKIYASRMDLFLKIAYATPKVTIYQRCNFIEELWRAKRACGAPWVSKSTHPRKIGNHVTVHHPMPVRPHHRHTNVYSHTF